MLIYLSEKGKIIHILQNLFIIFLIMYLADFSVIVNLLQIGYYLLKRGSLCSAFYYFLKF